MQHFWADSEYLGKINTKKNFKFFFQCLALPKDPQSFSSQNLRRPFLVPSRRLCGQVLFLPFGIKTGSRATATKAALQLAEHSILYYVICQKHQRKNGGKVDEI